MFYYKAQVGETPNSAEFLLFWVLRLFETIFQSLSSHLIGRGTKKRKIGYMRVKKNNQTLSRPAPTVSTTAFALLNVVSN